MGGVRVALGWCDISLSYLWSSFFLEEQNCFYGTVKPCPLAYGGVSESWVRAFGAYFYSRVHSLPVGGFEPHLLLGEANFLGDVSHERLLISPESLRKFLTLGCSLGVPTSSQLPALYTRDYGTCSNFSVQLPAIGFLRTKSISRQRAQPDPDLWVPPPTPLPGTPDCDSERRRGPAPSWSNWF